jgi:hypothetical protein
VGGFVVGALPISRLWPDECRFLDHVRAWNDEYQARARDNETRARWGLDLDAPRGTIYFLPRGAAPTGAHILDFRPFRRLLRAYKVALYEEGTKTGAISKMVLQAMPWLCAAAIAFLIVCMAVNK